jgi:putative toxin-antitoxin system antitoxin component (TIGR02293 family)
MTETNIFKKMVKTIGAEDMVKEPINNEYGLIPIIEKGLYMKNLMKLARLMSLSLKDIALILHISERTLRRYNNNRRLSPDISERLLKLSHLYTKGIELFKDKDVFTEWLNSDIAALNEKPINLLNTITGIQMIINVLGRIEYGVYS